MIFLSRFKNRSMFAVEKEPERTWPPFNENINSLFSTLDQTIKHVNDITSFSKVNLERKLKNLSLRHALIPEAEESANFPNFILPFEKNPKFYGRQKELERIMEGLSPRGGGEAYRTFTIYGRRGVGKTAIALQYAYENLRKGRDGRYDAVFWIHCETSVSIRQSFTRMAVSLNLPGADQNGHHEENLIAVHGWLKRTRKISVPLQYCKY